MPSATGQDNVTVMMKPFNCNQLLIGLYLRFLGYPGKGFPIGCDTQTCGDWYAHPAAGKANVDNCSGEQFRNIQ